MKCPICLNCLKFNSISALRCGHIFHLACIEQWIKELPQCPVCRGEASHEQIIRKIFLENNYEQNDIFQAQLGYILEQVEAVEIENAVLTEKLNCLHLQLKQQERTSISEGILTSMLGSVLTVVSDEELTRGGVEQCMKSGDVYLANVLFKKTVRPKEPEEQPKNFNYWTLLLAGGASVFAIKCLLSW